MTAQQLPPHKALNKAFLKVKPGRAAIETFKANLIDLLDRANDTESEEFHKNLVRDFLKNTGYDPAHFINTKGRNDLVIHNSTTAASTVGVILEAKKPTNRAEMMSAQRINAKALQELVLYYLRERITHKNLEVKHLIATNIYEWFVFDAALFDRLFAQNKKLVQQFRDFEEGRVADTKTDFFYRNIAAPAIDAVAADLSFAYFNLHDYQKPLRNADKADDTRLVALYKILSPEHLLKLPFANDSNSLDRRFYAELLHILGLAETKEEGKKIIGRPAPANRHSGALLEDAIIQLDSLDKISRLEKPSQYGTTLPERLFNVGLELTITWVNRILFLKLLEAQLIGYHKGDRSYAFLHSARIKSFDDLNSLFFQVLARRPEDRNADVKAAFSQVPYLNSSLFEPTDLEQTALFISNLRDDKPLPLHPQTVLKDNQGRRQTGTMATLDYLFAFLNAYDFGAENGTDIQEENKTLINASVLGLIFEKINGYKDGSFFTPGFITMYMCRETIRRAFLQKVNDRFRSSGHQNWQDLQTITDVYNRIGEGIGRQSINEVINSIRICDPAVGSGHFLVSALNEMIALKSELGALLDKEGRRIRHTVEVVNDELIIIDEDGNLFEYNPRNKESQRVQETLFHEKQNLIERCLFGVDINPNSVKICRLRLWIELLKSAYYKEAGMLETLPNIDINIKQGNSLVSRFALDADLSAALKKNKHTIDDYRRAVDTYRNAESKAQKREMESLIAGFKADFRSEISRTDPKARRLLRLSAELFRLTSQGQLFEMGAKERAAWAKQVALLTKDTRALEAEIESIRANKIFENAFEWRFEFPEILNDDGDFTGFDAVIGNPPYGVNFNKESAETYERLFSTYSSRGESYILFIEKGLSIIKSNGQLGYIVPDTLLNLKFTEPTRDYLLKNSRLHELDLLPSNVFADASVDTILLLLSKGIELNSTAEVRVNVYDKKLQIVDLKTPIKSFVINTSFWKENKSFNLQSSQRELEIIHRLDKRYPALESFCDLFSGVKTYEIGKGKPPQTKEIREIKPYTSTVRTSPEWLPFFDGKDIGYYQLLWKEDNWINYGPWLAAPREPEVFLGEKILIRKITGRTLIASYIPDTSYCNTLLFILKISGEKATISYRSLLGILNSSFIGWYFRKKFQINNEDTFPQIMIRDIQQFAVPNKDDEYTRAIENLVEEILLLKKQSPAADTAALEAEIDGLVYRLYGLSEEEIALVEGRAAL